MRYFNNLGLSLVQVMIAAGVMSIIMMGFMAMQTYQQRSLLATQTVISRNVLQLQLQQALVSSGSMSETLADTDAGNVALKNCLQPSGNSCIQTGSRGFYLVDSTGARIAGAGVAAPIRYSYTGMSCAAATPQCLFEVYTEYSATCPGGISPCLAPNVMGRYTIRQASGINPVGGTPLNAITSPAIPLFSGAGSSTVIFNTTVNAVNNGGGTPCHDACGGANELLLWSLACPGRYCRAFGYKAGVVQEVNCSSGINSPATVACFR